MPPADRHISQCAFHVRYAETDAMGLAHHAAYLVWFEEGRSAFIREQGWSYADIEASGYFLVAADLEARYRKAARYDQLVTVKTWIEDCRTRTISFGCAIVDADSEDLLFSASLKLVCLNASGQVTRIPLEWQAWLKT